jgi:ribosomal protein S18 acetylase RimI-like enzyme
MRLFTQKLVGAKDIVGSGMRITIEEINARNIRDVNKCEGEFIIDAKLVLHVENDEVRYTITELPRTTKRYGKDNVDYTTYIDNQDKEVFLAYIEGQVAGQIILRKNWSRYAYIEDIAVDVKFRRQGVSKELISEAKHWAQERNLAGIMLETQNNNVRACKFYESCGFQLRGFDTYLYKGINSDTDEVALYWYLVFGEALLNQRMQPNA